MQGHAFQFGDAVRHPKKPEWGVGSVLKAEHVTVEGQRAQRLSVRFPNAGLKTLTTSHAALEPVQGTGSNGHASTNSEALNEIDQLNSDGWLGEHGARKVTELMTTLPEEARDPFRTPTDRLSITLALYRFDASGRGLIDWAVAQSGMDDPLGRFTRQELEQYFNRWAMERDNHLIRVLNECRLDDRTLRALLDRAPRAAGEAVRRAGALG